MLEGVFPMYAVWSSAHKRLWCNSHRGAMDNKTPRVARRDEDEHVLARLNKWIECKKLIGASWPRHVRAQAALPEDELVEDWSVGTRAVTDGMSGRESE